MKNIQGTNEELKLYNKKDELVYTYTKCYMDDNVYNEFVYGNDGNVIYYVDSAENGKTKFHGYDGSLKRHSEKDEIVTSEEANKTLNKESATNWQGLTKDNHPPFGVPVLVTNIEENKEQGVFIPSVDKLYSITIEKDGVDFNFEDMQELQIEPTHFAYIDENINSENINSESVREQKLTIHSVSNSLVADIRNKLSSPKNLVAMLKESPLLHHPNVDIHEMIRKEMEQTLKNIEYLSSL